MSDLYNYRYDIITHISTDVVEDYVKMNKASKC